MERDQAEIVALQALAFVAADEELLPRFLNLTGMSLDDLRETARTADPAMLGAVLDFLLNHEPSLLAFAEATGTPASAPAKARPAFPGGGPVID